MKYMGSKAKYAKEILKFINQYRTSEDQLYIEPFVGGCNMIENIRGNRIGYDKNKYLISMWKALQQSWLPEDYYDLDSYQKAQKDCKHNTNNHYQDHEIGFIGFGCSYSGKFFGGYARGKNDNGVERNYTLESKKNIIKQLPSLKNVKFQCSDYKDIEIPDRSIIYCDPPYKGTTEYRTGKFDYEHFYNWLRQLGKNNMVFVSEYEIPSDFECIWEKQVNSSLTKDTGGKKSIEKLFKFKG